MNSKKVIIWATGIDSLLKGQGMVGGLTVQMMHWANTFADSGWDVTSLTNQKNNVGKTIGGIKFQAVKTLRFVNIIIEPLFIFLFLLKHKPNLIIIRGASRSLFALVISSKLLRIKLVGMLASDTDVKKGQELIAKPWDRWLFRQGLKGCKYLVAQNTLQKELTLQRLSKTNVIIIPNIWPVGTAVADNSKEEKNFILWVGNFRALKRPHWFLEMARQLPGYEFVMVGKAIDQDLYSDCENRANKLPNLKFMGGLPFTETQQLFSQCKLFVCTSEVEGFPNTFLQAWANNVPVITTFDPSNVVSDIDLGVVIKNREQGMEAIQQCFNNEGMYLSKQALIQSYFETAHAPNNQYKKIMELIS